MPLSQIAKLLNAFTTQSCHFLLPGQPEEQAAQDNQWLDVIGTQMKNSSDKKDMEKEIFFAEFAAPVKPFFFSFAWKFISEIGPFCPSFRNNFGLLSDAN